MKSILDFFRNRMKDFTFWDIAFLKTYGALPALVLGALFPDFVMKYLSLWIVLFTILLVRYSYLLFFKRSKTSTNLQ